MKVVQIGSNKGNDDLSNYLKKTYRELEFGLFVEANSLHIEDLKNCYQQYPSAVIENVAIKTPSDSNNTLTLYYRVDDAPGYCVASCIKEHVEGHTGLVGEMKTFSVPSITLDELFQRYNIIDLDWLLLDIEGIDAEILLSTNWARYNIKRIDYERIHLGDKKEQIEQMFINLGYKKVPGLQYVYDDGWIKEGAKNTEDITHYAVTQCEEGYEQQKGNFYYLKPIFDYYYSTQNPEKILKYGQEFLDFSKAYHDEYRVSILIQCSESFYQLEDIQSSVNYAIHALSEAIHFVEPYISQAFSYLYSLSIKVNNPNLIVFASGFSSQTLNTKERKEAIKTLANYE